MKGKARVCSVCLGKTNTIHVIEDVMKEVFDVLHLKLRLNAAEEHIMCTKCVEIVESLFEFKSRCLYTEDYLFPFVDNGQVNLKKIYSEMVKIQTENNNNALIGYEVCRFCLELVESGFFLSLTEVKRDVDLAGVLKEYLPELKDLQTITETGICMNCEESLRKYYKFTFRVGERYVAGENNSNKLDVRREPKTVVRGGNIQKNRSDDTSRSRQTSVPPKLYQCAKCEYQTEKRPNFNSHKFIHKDVSQVPAYKCSQCDYTTRYRRGMNCHQKLMHKDPSQLCLFSCDRCSFTTKYKHNVQIHKKVHQTERSFKCSRCSYSSKYLGGLRNHGKTHKEPIDISSVKFKTKPAHLASKMHYCDQCDYKTISKSRLTKQHALVHQDPSERPRFKCDRCSFTAFQKTSILDHQAIHKKPSEMTMYECATCSHKTDRKSSLKLHLLLHKSQEEVEMFTCDLCPYTSRYKTSITRHKLMRHKISDKKTRPKEKRLYQCFSCSYETTVRECFVGHLVVHRDVPEELMYKCDLCPYSSKRPVGLQDHMRVHRDVVECKTFDCHLCDFKTVHQPNLRRHKLIHGLKPKKKGRPRKSK